MNATTRMFSRKSAVALVGLVLAAVTFVFVQPSNAGGTTFIVNSTVDAADSNLNDPTCAADVSPRPNGPATACTLRAAIQQSNFLQETPDSGPVTITLPAGEYNLTRDGEDDNAFVGDLDITHGVAINGAGVLTTIVDGTGMQQCEHQRIFSNGADTSTEPVSFSGFTIQEGNATLGGVSCKAGRSAPRAAGISAQIGGGIFNAGDLTLTDMLVQHNDAGEAGGGIYNHGQGILTVTDSEIHNNIVGACPDTNGSGRGVNRAQGQDPYLGGGIANRGSMEVTGSLFIENEVRGRFEETDVEPRPSGSVANAAFGGGLYNASAGDTPMTDTDVVDNHVFIQNCKEGPSTRSPGRSAGGEALAQTQGGGIYNDTLLTLTNVLVGDPNLDDKFFEGNTAGRGGGIFNNGGGLDRRPAGPSLPVGLTMDDSRVVNNRAILTGGGIDNSGSMDVEATDVYANSTGKFLILPDRRHARPAGMVPFGAGGGLYNTGIALLHNDVLVGDPDHEDALFLGNEARQGGGIFNDSIGELTVDASHVDGNLAEIGGGIWNRGFADVRNGSTVSFNTAEVGKRLDRRPSNGRPSGATNIVGGGIFNTSSFDFRRPSVKINVNLLIEESTLEGNLAESGGGIYNYGDSKLYGGIQMDKSTVHHNTAIQEQHNECPCRPSGSARPQGLAVDSTGGGLFNIGFFIGENSTFSANKAAGNGGGIYVDNQGSLDIAHVTIADNFLFDPTPPEELRGSGVSFGGGLVDFTSDTSYYYATLFSNNTPQNCQGNGLFSQDNNMADDDTCPLDQANDELIDDALLGPLANNGGPTLTHMPDANSPAVDHIPPECLYSDDQRSVSRPQGPACEVGAVERSVGPPPSPEPTPTPTPTVTPTPTPSPSPTPEPECPGFEGDPRNDVIGTEEVDVLNGTPEDDIICAFESDDILRGFEGDDLLLAGPDDDRSFAGPGDDKIRSSTGNDESYGHDGDDEVRGGRGNDLIEGNEGDDTLRGYQNNDFVRGGSGDDRVLGFPGDDDVDGEGGNDFVKGGLGNDDLDGGPNNDECHGGQGSDTVQNCESGSPRVHARRVADRRSGV